MEKTYANLPILYLTIIQFLSSLINAANFRKFKSSPWFKEIAGQR
jgi:phage-related holin